jgi:hypothetical protein
MHSAEKIIDGLTQLMEGFLELQSHIEEDFDVSSPEAVDEGDEHDEDTQIEIEAALVTEIRAALEGVMDAEDLGLEEIASFVSLAQEALQEIDPTIFEDHEEEDDITDMSVVDGDEDYYDEDDDYDYDEYDDDEDEYDEDEEDE